MTDKQIDTIVQWVNAGAPQGNPKDMPAPRQWPDINQWQLAKQFGQPDLVIDSAPYTMPAQRAGRMVEADDHQSRSPSRAGCARLRSGPATPAGRRIMHHVLARLQQDEPDLRKTLFLGSDANSDGPGHADGMGDRKELRRVPSRHRQAACCPARISCGSCTSIPWVKRLPTTRSWRSISIRKGQEPKHRTYLMSYTANQARNGQLVLDIPPNTLKETQNFHVLKQPAILENFQPHMHLRGKAMSMEAILPDGTTEMLSYVDRFNFNWMINYVYADDAAPVLPAGTVLRITAWHDNTAANKNNPDPNQWVGWGERTVDEMSHAWVNVTPISEDEYQSYVAKKKSSEVASSRVPQP